MPIYSSDSEDNQNAQPVKLFGRKRPLHTVFGGGKVADITLWRNKGITGSILASFTIIWFLFEIAEFHFITLLCYILMTSMLALFLWNYGADFINRRPPTIQEIQLSEPILRFIFFHLNWFIAKLYEISSGEDLGRLVLALASLWIISAIGSYTSALNLLYITFLCFTTIPVLYERYEREVDYLATQGIRDTRKLYRKLDSRLLNRIPRRPVKEDRKFR